MLDLPPAVRDHPKGPRPSRTQRERCLQDDWIYLAWHFERSALTWAGDCGQRPTPEQGEELFHLPRAYTFVELRGRAGYLGSHLAGRVTRGCEWALRQREYKKDATLSFTAAPRLNFALAFLKLILRKVPKKFIPCHPRTSGPARLYTDAMWEPPNPCGVGVVYDAPEMSAPLASAAVTPSCVIEAFLDRVQQINQAEAFAGVIALASLGERLKGIDLIHFVDNLSALAGFIGGTATQEDSAAIFAIFHVLLVH